MNLNTTITNKGVYSNTTNNIKGLSKDNTEGKNGVNTDEINSSPEFHYIKEDEFFSLDLKERGELIQDSTNKIGVLLTTDDEFAPFELKELANNIVQLGKTFNDSNVNFNEVTQSNLRTVASSTNTLLSTQQYNDLLNYFITNSPIKYEFDTQSSNTLAYSSHKAYLDRLLNSISKLEHITITGSELCDKVRKIFDDGIKKQKDFLDKRLKYINSIFPLSNTSTITNCFNSMIAIHNNESSTIDKNQQLIFDKVKNVVNVISGPATANYFKNNYYFLITEACNITNNYIKDEINKLTDTLQAESDKIAAQIKKEKDDFIDANRDLFTFLNIDNLKSSKITLETLKQMKEVLTLSNYASYQDYAQKELKDKFNQLFSNNSLTKEKFNQEMIAVINSIKLNYTNTYRPQEVEFAHQQFQNYIRDSQGSSFNEINVLGLMLEMSVSLVYLNGETAKIFSEQADRLNQLSMKLSSFSSFLSKINTFYKKVLNEIHTRQTGDGKNNVTLLAVLEFDKLKDYTADITKAGYGLSGTNPLIPVSDVPEEFRQFFTKSADGKSLILTKDSLTNVVKDVSQNLASVSTSTSDDAKDNGLLFGLWGDAIFSSTRIEDLINSLGSELKTVNELLEKLNKNVTFFQGNVASSSKGIETMISIWAKH